MRRLRPAPCNDEKIYLGCVEMRDNKVLKVCNFQKRKYVKTFPTVEYWLSLIPIESWIKQFLQQVCCGVPNLITENDEAVNVAELVPPSPKNPINPAIFQYFINSAPQFDAGILVNNFIDKFKITGELEFMSILNQAQPAPNEPRTGSLQIDLRQRAQP